MDMFKFSVIFVITIFLNIFLVYTIGIDKNIVLSSVYDAMKTNIHPKTHKDNSVTPVKKMNLLSDSRDKRQSSEYYRRSGYYNDYDDFVQDPERKCKEILRPQVVKFSIPDNSVSLATKFFQFLKAVLLTVGAITLPLLILHALILPFKIFMALKTVAIANTLLLGTLAYKAFGNTHHHHYNSTTHDHDHDHNHNHHGHDYDDSDAETANEYDEHYDGETNEIDDNSGSFDELYTNKLKDILRSINTRNSKW